VTTQNLRSHPESYLESVYVQSHSKNSVKSYRTGLNQFTKFLEQSYQCTVDDLVARIKSGDLDIYRILKEFVIYLDKIGKKPASIKVWVGAAKGYLRFLGIKIYSEDFKQMVKLPKKVKHREEPLTKEILLRLLHNLPAKLQTVVLLATASGMRIGEIVQLKISDIDFNSKPTRIKIRAEITKTKEARETYLTTEATISLKDYLKRFFGWIENESNGSLEDQVIFGRKALVRREEDDSKPSTKIRKSDSQLKSTPVLVAASVLSVSLKSHIKNIPELSRLNENGRFMIHFHAFRKFFRTVVGDATNRDYAEALMGHHFYMDTYYNLPEGKRRETYLKAEPYLTISDFARIEKDLSKITEKQNEIEEEHLMFKQFFAKNYAGFPKSLEHYMKD